MFTGRIHGQLRRWAFGLLAAAALAGGVSGMTAVSHAGSAGRSSHQMSAAPSRQVAALDAAFSCDGSAAVACGRIYGLNGNCVDLAGNSQSDFNGVDLWPCWSGDTAQYWAWRFNTSASNQIQGTINLAENAGYCLGTVDGAQADGTGVDIYQCNGTTAENWSYDSGTKEIHNAASGKCLDVTSWQDQGVQLQIWSCSGDYNQQFNFVPGEN